MKLKETIDHWLSGCYKNSTLQKQFLGEVMSENQLIAVVGSSDQWNLASRAAFKVPLRVSGRNYQEPLLTLDIDRPDFVVVFGRDAGHISRRLRSVKVILPNAPVLAVYSHNPDLAAEEIGELFAISGADVVAFSAAWEDPTVAIVAGMKELIKSAERPKSRPVFVGIEELNPVPC